MRPSPIVCTPAMEDTYEEVEKDEFDAEKLDKELVLEFLKISTQPSATVGYANTIPLQFRTEDIQKDIKFYRGAVKIDVMAKAWDVFDACDKEKMIDAIKHP